MRRPSWRGVDLRLFAVGLIFIAAWAGIGYRLFTVQGANAAEFAQRGFEQRVRHEEIEPPRGTIYDRDGIELAVTVQGAAVIADPRAIEEPVAVAELLAPILGSNYVDLAQKLSGEGRFSYVARRIERDVADQVAAVIEGNEVVGLTIVDEPIRVYPAGPLASNIVGITRNDDGTGLEGLEMLFDGNLAGAPGKLIVERDPAGRVIPQGEYLVEPATPGDDIVLTLDRDVQFIAERALEDAVFRTAATWGAVVVLRPQTGEILAMASAPSFDPSDRSALDPEMMRNRAIAEVYEPGSTLKVLAVAGAIEEGIVDSATPIDTPRSIQIGDATYVEGGFPAWMSVADVVTYSSNVGAITIQRRLGDEEHYAYLDAFGLGRPASIDFLGEASGNLPHVDAWCVPCGSSAAIGYGVSVTPLQIAAAYAAIANNGEWVEPYIVSEIVDADGDRELTEPRRHRVISTQTAISLRRMLASVVERGTGTRAAVDGFVVGGKTGTADRFDVDTARYSDTDTIASFIGMAPIDDPEVVIAIVLDSPRGTLPDGADMKFGGASAAPVFAEIAGPVLHLLGVAPDPAAARDD